MRFVNVIVPIPLDREYTYRVPEDVDVDVDVVGHRVRVPFSKRSLVGVVTAHARAQTEEGRILEIEEVLDETPAFDAELLELTRWIARYYACSWGEAARAALPPDGRPKKQLFVSLGGDTDGLAVRGARQRAVLQAVGSGHARPAAEVLAETGASHATLRSLEAKGLIRIFEDDRDLTGGSEHGSEIRLERFHPSQRAAAETLREALAANAYRTFLLHGVTGSGKTEVYIDALRETIRRGKTGIVLVPEIALTPQTVGRFRSHFGDKVAVLHSRLSAGSRFDTWRRVRRGDFPVVIGPRSAVFAPVSNLGLVVVDEEHESSYKQFEPAPRYHARDVAVMRASMAGAVCVLGSATPSLESYHNAQNGKYRLIQMPDRVPVGDGKPARLPRVRVVDMLADRHPDRPHSVISGALRQAISDRLDRREQIILLQNRRGFAPVLSCDTCGAVPECPDCSVTLTWHKHKHQARCHYCGRAFRAEWACRACDSGTLEPIGAGTQRVEEELEALFPAVRVLRMDLDTTSTRNAHAGILQAFGEGEADILVGTQMVAKGLDFDRVTLVGVVDADAGLLFPDFRSDERTFQLLTQVAGRAGRSTLEGEVIFQTRNSRHPVILLARRHDYRAFAQAALDARQVLDYPPFVRAVRLEFRGPHEPAVKDASVRFATAFRGQKNGMELVGPAPAFIARIRKSWRYLALAKVPRGMSGEAVRGAIDLAIRSVGRLRRGTRLNVDVDPMGML